MYDSATAIFRIHVVRRGRAGLGQKKKELKQPSSLLASRGTMEGKQKYYRKAKLPKNRQFGRHTSSYPKNKKADKGNSRHILWPTPAGLNGVP